MNQSLNKYKIFCWLRLHKWYKRQTWTFQFDKETNKQVKTHEELKTCKRCWKEIKTVYQYDEQLKTWVRKKIQHL